MKQVDQKENSIRGASRFHLMAKTLYRALPPGLRTFAGPMKSAYGLLRRLRPEVWTVEGDEKGSHSPVSVCLYFTTHEYKSYLIELIFGSSFRARHLGRTWRWNVLKRIPEAARGCSMVIAEVDQRRQNLLGARSGIVIPVWISGEIYLPRAPKIMKSKSRQYVLRKIRQNGLEFEISRDPLRFHDFYHNMYLPYIEEAHGEKALFRNWEDLKTQFDNGELFLVKKQGEYISGTLINYDGGGPHLKCVGIRSGNREYLRAGALSAAYEFCLLHFEAKGCAKVELGRSRAFLQDGVLRFKKSLPQTIVGASADKFLLQVLLDTSATRAFLRDNPFIFERSGKLHGAVLIDGEKPPTPQALGEIKKQHSHPGLQSLVVYWFGPGETAAGNDIERELETDIASDQPSCPFAWPRYKQMLVADGAEFIREFGLIGKTMAIDIHLENEGQYSLAPKPIHGSESR